MTTSINRPLKMLTDGALRAVLWRNETEKGPRYSVEICRSYKDKDDNFRTTSRFSPSELLRVSKLAERAYEEVHAHRE